ncbi:penicillin-binding protein 2 [Sulfurimonas sp. HSL3-7]|uniref:peptidoglycan D,D-transpeptidase FtsI family protein n=1 Tax=Sulfonitrofixus jiaomeiensis TaxID=3131938 RepID=UPI0031F8F07B
MVDDDKKASKVLLLFIFLVIGFLIFLSTMFYTAVKPRDLPSRFISDTTKAERSSIISADGFHLAISKKVYKAMINTKNLDPDKKELFIQLFSIYSNIPAETIRRKIRRRKGAVTLSYSISEQRAQYLKSLAFELRRLNVFQEYQTPNGRHILQGLDIIESGEARIYPYGDLLTPVIGYPKKHEDHGYTRSHGMKGIERKYNDDLSPRQDGLQRGPRDVNGYMILNKESHTKYALNGLDVKLTIPVTLQSRVERMCDKMQEKMGARQIIVTVMESETGRMRVLATSNRFKPKDIQPEDIPSLQVHAVEYSFEPGSVLKPIIFALLMKHKLVNPFEVVNTHNGRFKIGKRIITDEHKMHYMSAENVIVHSSNIGIAQLAQRLNASDYHQGLLDFGFTQPSGIDLTNEYLGKIPTMRQLDSETYKASASYGYAVRANLIQLLKAYNVFNNSGRMVTPRLTQEYIDETGRSIPLEQEEPMQLLNPETAERIKRILVKTAVEGTGQKALVDGIEIGGKTGTAQISERGHYQQKYNTSFIGFANDSAHNYTIGVTVIRPKIAYRFAAQSAAPVFRETVELLIEEGLLKPKCDK